MIPELRYRIIAINGDYASAESENGGATDIALALLPPEVDEGDTVVFKDCEYQILN